MSVFSGGYFCRTRLLELTDFQECFRDALPFWLNKAYNTTLERVQRAVQLDMVYFSTCISRSQSCLHSAGFSNTPLPHMSPILPPVAAAPADGHGACEAQLICGGPGFLPAAHLPAVGASGLARPRGGLHAHGQTD